MNKSLLSMAALSGLILLSGCSIFVPRTQTITVNGIPTGAQVVVNGRVMHSPASVNVPCNRTVQIQVSKKGYYPCYLNGSYSLSTTGILDLIGFFVFVVPALGFISPGAFTLDQDTFYYELVPVQPEK